jgi:predicted nucleic acid-binding protein
MKYVFDTSAVIYLLEKWGLLEKLLLFTSENDLCIPPRVREEFVSGDLGASDVKNLDRVFSVVQVKLDADLLPYFNYDASDGAVWVMSYTRQNPGDCCVIDEEFARDLCQFLRVRFTGCIGILKEMHESSIISSRELLQVKERIRKSSFYCTGRLLKELDNCIKA